MADAVVQARSVSVTVIVPTLNESTRIATCLASVAWAAEVIVADGGSEDDTVARARQAGARIVEIPGGWIADQRNSAIAAARHDWILALDADEIASPELAGEVARVVAAPGAEAYRIRRRNFQYGVELADGSWGRDWVTRLFRADRRYRRHRVHERLEPGPEAGRLGATILHTPYRDLAHHVEKIQRYARWAAADLADLGVEASWLALAGRPLVRFWRSYLLEGEWRRGSAGVVAAALGSYGVFLKYAFLRERLPPSGSGTTDGP